MNKFTLSLFFIVSTLAITKTLLISAESPITAGSRSPRVLVADDSEITQLMTKSMLTSLGYDVTQAYDGAGALICIAKATEAKEPFDAILMDMDMKNNQTGLGMNGDEALIIISSNPSLRTTPVIAFSGEDENNKRLLALGAIDVLPKPSKKEAMKKIIERAISRPTTPCP